ncbi:MAG: glycosyltransferase family 2 protein [Isosphaeraceae bacterium]|nr:glycosyltransferase family 2 protein [Isosphaeraceae bacterium]
MSGRRISFVIPSYNEEESLDQLHAELHAATQGAGLEIAEILFVDDGSRDGTWAKIQQLSLRDPLVKAIRFRRNFGKAAALSAGFGAATGDVVFTLDADLQDDPAEIPNFLAKLDEGFDVVSGWKRRRHDPWHKVGPSRIFNRMVSWVSGCRLHDHNCGFKAYRREVLDEVELYGELHRFVPVLAHARGFRVSEVVVNHRSRVHGRSKYGFSRFIKGFLDIMTVQFLSRFGQRPLHLLGGIGLVFIAVGVVGLLFLAGLWLLDRGPIGTRPLLPYSALLVGLGTQLICFGVLAELLTSYHIRDVKTYSVADRVGWSRVSPSVDSVEGRDRSSRPPDRGNSDA